MLGRRPLDEACLRGHTESVEVLLLAGSPAYASPFNAFQYCSELRVLQAVAQHYPAQGSSSQPSFAYIFTQLANLALLTEVLSWAPIHLSEVHNGFSLLQRIAQTKRLEFLRLLLPLSDSSAEELKSLINNSSESGSCLWLALPNYELLEEFRLLGGDFRLLKFVDCYRIYQGHKGLIHYLLGEGLDLNERDEAGKTAFWYACDEFHVGMQMELLRMGCQVDCEDARGWTPLHEACLKGYFVQVKLLLKHGANPQRMNRAGESVIVLVQRPYRGKTATTVKKLIALLKSYQEGTFIDS